MEQTFNDIQTMINSLYAKQQQLSSLVAHLTLVPEQAVLLADAKKLS